MNEKELAQIHTDWIEELEEDRKTHSMRVNGLDGEAKKYALYAKINPRPLKWSRICEYLIDKFEVTLQPETIRKKVAIEIDKFQTWCRFKGYNKDAKHIDEFLNQ